jgi:hypothetical protein
MIVHEIHDLSNQYVVNLLKKGLSQIDNKSYITNYHPDYESTPGNLFNILKNGRYNLGHGKYYVIEDSGTYIASAGWNEYDIEPSIALLLTRMYTMPLHRMNYHVANNILPLALAEIKNYEHIWFICNEYNKKIYNWFVRVHEGKRGALFNDWPDIYRNFKPIGKKTIYYTEQYVMEYQR